MLLIVWVIHIKELSVLLRQERHARPGLLRYDRYSIPFTTVSFTKIGKTYQKWTAKAGFYRKLTAKFNFVNFEFY